MAIGRVQKRLAVAAPAGRCDGAPDELTRRMSGVRREARYYIPGAARKHSKEVLG